MEEQDNFRNRMISLRGTGSSDMDARLWHFLGSQRVELKAGPFFLLALRAGRPREVGFY